MVDGSVPGRPQRVPLGYSRCLGSAARGGGCLLGVGSCRITVL